MKRTLVVFRGLHSPWVALLVGSLVLSAAEKPAPPVGGADPAQAEAELVELFASDSNITNSLGAILVHVPDGYRVGRTEVTQSQYEKVMQANPSKFRGANLPVQMVSPTEAAAFCARLTEQERQAGLLPAGFTYQLPSEQEFDSYIRGTPDSSACISLHGDLFAPIAVASLPANPLGLHDVFGNVWEWCQGNVARGSSYQSHEDYLKHSFRYVGDPSLTMEDIGFRVVLKGSAAKK